MCPLVSCIFYLNIHHIFIIPHNWNDTIYNLSWMASFTWWYALVFSMFCHDWQLFCFYWEHSLAGCTSVYLAICLLKNMVVASTFYRLWIKLLWTSACRYLWSCIFQFFRVKPRSVLLATTVRICLAFQESPQISSKLWYHFAFSQ